MVRLGSLLLDYTWRIFWMPPQNTVLFHEFDMKSGMINTKKRILLLCCIDMIYFSLPLVNLGINIAYSIWYIDASLKEVLSLVFFCMCGLLYDAGRDDCKFSSNMTFNFTSKNTILGWYKKAHGKKHHVSPRPICRINPINQYKKYQYHF